MSLHRAVVVGSGFGCRIQVPALRAAGFDVVGLVGTDLQRTRVRASVNNIPGAFTDLDLAISETVPAAVVVSSPPSSHSAMVLTAIRRGCHVLCEKPFALSLSEAEYMLRAAREAGIVHLIGHEFRYVPQYAMVAQAVADGAIGQPKFFAFVQFNSYLRDFAQDIPSWWFDPAAGGGWLGASGSHMVDQVRAVLGEIDSVSAALPRVAPQSVGVEDSLVIKMHLANGADGAVMQTGADLGGAENLFRITGTEGSIWIDGGRVILATQKGLCELDVPANLMLPEAPLSSDPRQDSAEWTRLAAVELRPYAQLCSHFQSMIEGSAQPSPVNPATFLDGMECMRVIEAVRHSAAAGGAVTLVANNRTTG